MGRRQRAPPPRPGSRARSLRLHAPPQSQAQGGLRGQGKSQGGSLCCTPHCGREGPLLSASPSHGRGTEMLPWGQGCSVPPPACVRPKSAPFSTSGPPGSQFIPFRDGPKAGDRLGLGNRFTRTPSRTAGAGKSSLYLQLLLWASREAPPIPTHVHMGPWGPRDMAMQVCKAQALLTTPCGHPSQEASVPSTAGEPAGRQEQQGGGAATCAPAPRVPSATSTSGRWPGPPLSSASQVWSPHQQHQYRPGPAQTRHEGQTMGGPPSLSERPHDAVTEALLH